MGKTFQGSNATLIGLNLQIVKLWKSEGDQHQIQLLLKFHGEPLKLFY